MSYVYIFQYILFIIHWKKALNFDIIDARRLYVKWLLKYQVLKLLVHFSTKKYSTQGALRRFDEKVIRINVKDYSFNVTHQTQPLSVHFAIYEVRAYLRARRLKKWHLLVLLEKIRWLEECLPRCLIEHNLLCNAETLKEFIDHDTACAQGSVEGGVLFGVCGGDNWHQMEAVLHVDAWVPHLQTKKVPNNAIAEYIETFLALYFTLSFCQRHEYKFLITRSILQVL